MGGRRGTRLNTVKEIELPSRSFAFDNVLQFLGIYTRYIWIGWIVLAKKDSLEKKDLLLQLPETWTTCIYGGLGRMNISLKTLQKILGILLSINYNCQLYSSKSIAILQNSAIPSSKADCRIFTLSSVDVAINFASIKPSLKVKTKHST